MKTLCEYLLLLALLSFSSSCSREGSEQIAAEPIPLTFDKSSDELNVTVVVPNLDAPLSPGTNVIWCASFQAAWKALEELAGEPVAFEEPADAAKGLNEAVDPRSYLPPASLYAISGWNDKGVTNQIQNDLKQRFPDKRPPVFPGILPESFVAYAYLEADIKFPLPYDQNAQPLFFTERGGNKVAVQSFGVSPKNHNAEDKLWTQPYVLFRKGETLATAETGAASFEFAIDLCSNSSPNQVVVARIAREATLGAALARIDKEIAETRDVYGLEALLLHKVESIDTLFIPDFHWTISHRFRELEGRHFTNQKLIKQSLDVAQQDITFRLDRSGAALRSESKLDATGMPADFSFDRPFLLYMKKRGEKMPFFVMWLENAELMRPWHDAALSTNAAVAAQGKAQPAPSADLGSQ